jgi:hypothetical protein
VAVTEEEESVKRAEVMEGEAAEHLEVVTALTKWF